MDSSSIRQAANLILSSSYTVALTGAGISTPSGIPDFRSPDSGMWYSVDPLRVASIWGFHEHPEEFYRWFTPLARKIRHAEPNAAHYALAELERAGLLRLLLTQNVDELHQRAGSQHVVELHGNLRTGTCMQCFHTMTASEIWARIDLGELPACSRCQSPIKPNVVLFGEPLAYDGIKAAQQAALQCSVMIAAGSSLEVEPAADLPHLASRRGARIIIIDRQPTTSDHIAEVVIRGDVAMALPELVSACRGARR